MTLHTRQASRIYINHSVTKTSQKDAQHAGKSVSALPAVVVAGDLAVVATDTAEAAAQEEAADTTEAPDRPLLRFVRNAEKRHRSHSSQEVTSPYIAVIATQKEKRNKQTGMAI